MNELYLFFCFLVNELFSLFLMVQNSKYRKLWGSVSPLETLQPYANPRSRYPGSSFLDFLLVFHLLFFLYILFVWLVVIYLFVYFLLLLCVYMCIYLFNLVTPRKLSFNVLVKNHSFSGK